MSMEANILLHASLHILAVYPDDGIMNISSEGNKETIRDFYAVILPSLKRLHNDLVEQESSHNLTKMIDKKNVSWHGRRQSTIDQEREDECGIFLVPTAKMVLPGCCHEMCITCYRDWDRVSESQFSQVLDKDLDQILQSASFWLKVGLRNLL